MVAAAGSRPFEQQSGDNPFALRAMAEGGKDQGATLACCVCGPRMTSRPYRRIDGFVYRRCKGCGLVFLATDQNVAAAFYRDTTKGDSPRLAQDKAGRHSIEYWSVPRMFMKHRQVFERFFADRLDRLCQAGYSGGPRLAIGCGYGFFVKFLVDRGLPAAGIDTAAEQVAWARERWGLDLAVSAVEDFVPAAKQEAIVMADVLEHVWDPVAVLRQVRQMLVPEGVLAVQVPNVLRGLVPPGHSWGVPHHLWQFSRRTLGRVLAEAGFRVESWSTGVLGVIGMYERGGPSRRERLYMWLARRLKIGNRLLVLCRPKKTVPATSALPRPGRKARDGTD